MTYERLKQIVVSYPELSKCPELKVGARCYLGGATFQDFGWNARRGGVILRDQSVLQLCNLSLSSFAGESLPQADLPCVFRRQLGELGKYTPYGLIV